MKTPVIFCEGFKYLAKKEVCARKSYVFHVQGLYIYFKCKNEICISLLFFLLVLSLEPVSNLGRRLQKKPVLKPQYSVQGVRQRHPTSPSKQTQTANAR